MRRQKSIQDWQDATQEAANMSAALNNSQDYQEDYLRQFRTAARLGKTLGAKGIYITDGGDATKIGNNTYLLRGGSHEDVNETGQTGIGINVGGNEVEAEGGEVAQKKNGALRIFSAQPILGNGMSPAQAILRGYNKDKVFNAQQAFKKRNGLKDDGSKAKWGTNDWINVAKTVGGYMPIIGTLEDAYELYKHPSLEQAGWTALGALSDIAGGRAIIKSIRLARNAKKAYDASKTTLNAYKLIRAKTNAQKAKTMGTILPGVDNVLQYNINRLNNDVKRLGGLTSKDRGSSKYPYPSVSSKDFAGSGRSYPIPTKADAVDALRLAGLHGRSDVRSKVYSKYPSLRKKSLLGSCSRPVKGMRTKFSIGGEEKDRGYDMTGEISPVISTAKWRTPRFATVDTTARDIPNFGTIKIPTYTSLSDVTYIPQRHNRSRTIFSSGDYLGLGIDTLAALSTGLVNYNTAGKYTLPDRAPIIQASKLPTTYNVNPEIEEVKRYRDRLTGQTFNNTSSSVAALNRSGAINLDALSNLSKLWATKENEENKMLTEDAKNQQTVAAQNVQNELARQSEIARIKNEANQAKGDALNIGLSGLSQAWTNFWTAGRTAYEDDQSRRAMIASSKEATPTRLSEMDFDLSPDILASLYRTAKDDRTKRFYLSRLSPKQRQKYGIN